MARGLSKSWCFVDEPPGHGQQARLFAKRLGHFLEPGAARPARARSEDERASVSLRVRAWVIEASPRAASQPCQPNSCTLVVAVRAAHQRSRASGPVYL